MEVTQQGWDKINEMIVEFMDRLIVTGQRYGLREDEVRDMLGMKVMTGKLAPYKFKLDGNR